MPNASKNSEKLHLSSIAGKNMKCVVILKSGLVIPLNINYTPSIRAAITLLGNYPRGMKTYVHKNLYINIQRSFIDNGQKPEVIKKLFDKE